MRAYALRGKEIYDYIGGAVKKGLGGDVSKQDSIPSIRVWGKYGNYELHIRWVGSKNVEKTVETAGQIVADLYASPGHRGEILSSLPDETLEQGAIVLTQLIRSQTEQCLAPPNAASQHCDGLPLPARFRWLRKSAVGQSHTLVPQSTSNVYQICADDIGTSILVEATPESHDGTYWGTAHGEIGPFDIDPRSREILDNGFANETLSFPVRLIETGSPHHSTDIHKQLSVQIMAESLRILQPGPMNIGYVKQWSAKYGADYPTIELDSSDCCRFTVDLNAKETLQLEALSRSQRDLIALAVRSFQARTFIANTTLLESTLNPPGALTSSSNSVDLCCIIQKLRSELRLALQLNETARIERDRAEKEKESLQDDLTATIEAFQVQLSCDTDKSPEPYPHHSNSVVSSSALIDAEQEIVRLKSELERIRSPRSGTHLVNRRVETNEEDWPLELEETKKTVATLRATVEELNFEAARKEQATKEHNIEIENAFLQAKAHRDQLLRLNEELQQKVFMLREENLSSQGGAAEEAVERVKTLEIEVTRLNTALDEAITDRNRFARLTESVTRELDKLRSTYNQLTARLETEAIQYQDENKNLTANLNQLEKTLEDSRKRVAEAEAQTERLENSLKTKEAEFSDIKLEVESLKVRLRKLAMSSQPAN